MRGLLLLMVLGGCQTGESEEAIFDPPAPPPKTELTLTLATGDVMIGTTPAGLTGTVRTSGISYGIVARVTSGQRDWQLTMLDVPAPQGTFQVGLPQDKADAQVSSNENRETAALSPSGRVTLSMSHGHMTARVESPLPELAGTLEGTFRVTCLVPRPDLSAGGATGPDEVFVEANPQEDPRCTSLRDVL